MTDFQTKKLDSAQTLGDILKQARQKKNVTLEQAEEETKVRIKYLKALEDDKNELLPASVYAIGFLTKYADFLELEAEELIKKFKLGRGSAANFSTLAPEKKIKESFFTITPRVIFVTSVVVAILGIIGYIAYSVNKFTSPPNLEISSPLAEKVIKEDHVVIIGKTDDSVILTINNQSVSADDKGNFNQDVKLNPGLNTFEIKAIGPSRKETIRLIKILADLPTMAVEEPSQIDANSKKDQTNKNSTQKEGQKGTNVSS